MIRELLPIIKKIKFLKNMLTNGESYSIICHVFRKHKCASGSVVERDLAKVEARGFESRLALFLFQKSDFYKK